MKKDKETQVLLAYNELDVRGWITPSPQKLLEIDSFRTGMPAELREFVEYRYRRLLRLCCDFRIGEWESQETKFTTEMAGVIHLELSRCRIGVERHSNKLNLTVLTLCVALALYVKHLGLNNSPAFLRWHDTDPQVIVRTGQRI